MRVKGPSSATEGHTPRRRSHELFALLKHPATFEDHPHQSDGPLNAIRILLRHIRVTYKDNQLFALTPLLNVRIGTSKNALKGEIDDEGASYLPI